MEQLEIFETPSGDLQDKRDKSVLEAANARIANAKATKMEIELAKLRGEMADKTDFQAVIQVICEQFKEWMNYCNEVIPFEVFGKSIEENKKICAAASGNALGKILKTLELYIEEKEGYDA